MNHFKPQFFLVFTLIVSINSFSQTNDDELSLEKGTIDNQFEYIIKKSGNFTGNNGQMYEAVNLNMLLTLRSNTIDSLTTIHKDLADIKVIVDQQAKEIIDLKSNLEATKDILNKTKANNSSMPFFGAQISKTGYSVLIWAIIGGLLALLLLFVYKFKNSHVITSNAKRALAEIEEEFDEHRRTALEREQKVRRQLQDEINKQKKV